MGTGTRELTFLLAKPERRLLQGIAARLPRRVTSDHLTMVGVMGALATGVAYALSGRHPAWLWVASAALAVNWFGDSLDGTLARVRQVERPRYGYYLDHLVDAFSTAAVGIGIGLSPFVNAELALLLVVAYLALSINVYLESAVFGVFQLGYGWIGPTEARLILVAANALLFGAVLAGDRAVAWITVLGNATACLLAAGMVAILTVRFARNLQRLARLEPLKRM